MVITETYTIADIFLSLNWDSNRSKIIFAPTYSAFLSPRHSAKESNISFCIQEWRTIDLEFYRELFNTLPEGLWKIWREKSGNSYLISLHRITSGNSPYRFAIANSDFTEFHIFNNNGQIEFRPFEYPLDELAISGYLNINKIGILLHSAMVSINGRGFLFPGTSGSGKSTLSELWLKDKDSEVLTDERVIIREKNGLLYSFGTPWHGTAGIHKNKGTPLHKIFFIKHGKENSLRRISVFDAANRLMVRCFPTFWHKEGMQFALDLCIRIASEIECYEFGFVPDLSAVEIIKENIK